MKVSTMYKGAGVEADQLLGDWETPDIFRAENPSGFGLLPDDLQLYKEDDAGAGTIRKPITMGMLRTSFRQANTQIVSKDTVFFADNTPEGLAHTGIFELQEKFQAFGYIFRRISWHSTESTDSMGDDKNTAGTVRMVRLSVESPRGFGDPENDYYECLVWVIFNDKSWKLNQITIDGIGGKKIYYYDEHGWGETR